MRRILVLLTVVALMMVMLAMSASTAFAVNVNGAEGFCENSSGVVHVFSHNPNLVIFPMECA
jgi:hypothetical protein